MSQQPDRQQRVFYLVIIGACIVLLLYIICFSEDYPKLFSPPIQWITLIILIAMFVYKYFSTGSQDYLNRESIRKSVANVRTDQKNDFYSKQYFSEKSNQDAMKFVEDTNRNLNSSRYINQKLFDEFRDYSPIPKNKNLFTALNTPYERDYFPRPSPSGPENWVPRPMPKESPFNQTNTSQTLEKLKINKNEFFEWVDKNMKDYMFQKLLPEIIKRHENNLKNLNEYLFNFNVRLVEYDPDYRMTRLPNSQDTYRGTTSSTTSMKLAQLIPMRSNAYDKWGSFFTVNNGLSAAKIREIQQNIQHEIEQRLQLDNLIHVKGYNLSDVRMLVFKRLDSMLANKSVNYENNKFDTKRKLPSDNDIILHIFISSIMTLDSFYKGKLIQDIIIEPSMPILKTREQDFYLKKVNKDGEEEYKIYAGEGKEKDKKWYPYKGSLHIWSVMVFFLIHVKNKHMDLKQEKEKNNESTRQLKEIINFILKQNFG